MEQCERSLISPSKLQKNFTQTFFKDLSSMLCELNRYFVSGVPLVTTVQMAAKLNCHAYLEVSKMNSINPPASSALLDIIVIALL